MLKVVDSLKKALQIMADEYNAKVFEVDGTIFTADQGSLPLRKIL